MKLEKIIIDNTEYYQWVILGNSDNDFKNSIGDLFTDWNDIEIEKQKALAQFEK